MTNELESTVRSFLKNLLHDAAADLVNELKASIRHQKPHATLTDCRFLLTSREAAKRLSISERHLFQLTRTGQLPCLRIGRSVRYSVETIQKWVRETESAEPPSTTGREAFEQVLMKSAASTSPRPNTRPSKGQKQRGATKKTLALPPSRSPKVRQRVSNRKPQEVQSDERISPFSVLLSEHGIERSRLGPITNGELRRIAEVDIATMHGWQYLDRPLPPEAIGRLTNHFRQMVMERTGTQSSQSWEVGPGLQKL